MTEGTTANGDQQRYCTNCGGRLQPGGRFCASCGTAIAQTPETGPFSVPSQAGVPPFRRRPQTRPVGEQRVTEGAERPATPQMKESETPQQSEESPKPTPPEDLPPPQKVAVHAPVSALGELATQPRYPVRFEIDYPERQSRLKALLRLPLSIPLFILLYLLSNAADVAIIAAILVRGRIPRWLFEFRVAASRWIYRAGAYVLLLTDEYAPFEGDHAVSYDVTYPDKLSRWKLLVWKFITSVPHFFVIAVLTLTLVVVVPIGWVAILFTGRFPRGLHGYVTGVLRWGARVSAYSISLTDEFPPFSLSPDAGSGGGRSYIVSSVAGLLAVTAVIGLFVTILVVFVVGSQRIVTEVSYERLLAGATRPPEGVAEVHSGRFALRAATDPADDQYAFLAARPDYRLVELRFIIKNWRGAGEEVPIRTRRFELQDTGGGTHEPLLAIVNRREIAPFDIGSGDTAALQLVFELPVNADPLELEYDVLEYIDYPRLGETIVWEFR